MFTWLILSIWWAGCILAWPKIAYVVAHDFACGMGLTGEDVIIGCIIATFAMFLWPIIWPGYAIHQSSLTGEKVAPLMIAPRAIRKAEKERAYKARIRELERECGIR